MSEENSNAKTSTALDFKKRREASEKGEMLTLVGSGLSVRVRRPQINKMIAMGLIPDRLASFMIRADQKDIDPKDLPNLLEMQRIIARHTVIEPKIVDKPNYDAGEISIDDLEDADVSSVWIWYTGGAKALDSFRNEREGVTARPSMPKVSEPKTK